MQLENKKDVPTTVNYIPLLMISKNKWHSLTIVNTVGTKRSLNGIVSTLMDTQQQEA
jgi:hypothetical protein